LSNRRRGIVEAGWARISTGVSANAGSVAAETSGICPPQSSRTCSNILTKRTISVRRSPASPSWQERRVRGGLRFASSLAAGVLPPLEDDNWGRSHASPHRSPLPVQGRTGELTQHSSGHSQDKSVKPAGLTNRQTRSTGPARLLSLRRYPALASGCSTVPSFGASLS